MTKELKDLYQKFLDMEDNERVGCARACVEDIIEGFNKIGLSSQPIATIIIGIFSAASAADHKINYEEYELLIKVMDVDLSYDDFYEACRTGSLESIVSEIDKIADEVGEVDMDLKYSICILILCICACNGELTVEEQRLIARILD